MKSKGILAEPCCLLGSSFSDPGSQSSLTSMNRRTTNYSPNKVTTTKDYTTQHKQLTAESIVTVVGRHSDNLPPNINNTLSFTAMVNFSTEYSCNSSCFISLITSVLTFPFSSKAKALVLKPRSHMSWFSSASDCSKSYCVLVGDQSNPQSGLSSLETMAGVLLLCGISLGILSKIFKAAAVCVCVCVFHCASLAGEGIITTQHTHNACQPQS